ncbi:hypothetical protein [Flavobacterium chungbukense]|uniref:Uncharacterized protein n=1 Tax=Flavobacterium chungbukense TaxID=877464 RepID=A0ABP7XVS9_9FLAO|nr:hypothetical protein [Flavobacterium chungbukense]MCC4921710.1 hypothetical protein [Flavobacterium chungbukense]
MAKNDTFQERHLLRIEDYEFQDGNGVRDKYMIVLNRNEDSAFIIHTLTTKQAQGFNPLKTGCSAINNFTFFYISKDEVIGENGFSFELDTFIFFTNNIRKQSLQSLQKYPEKNVILQDVVNKKFLKELIDCMLNSIFITSEQADSLRKSRIKL